MKLALKIVAICLIAMILITSITNYWIARREYQMVKETHQSDARRIGGLISESLDLAYNSEGHQGIVKVIKTHAVDTGEMKYRWVWFDVSVGDENHPAVPHEVLEKIMKGEMDSFTTACAGPDMLHTYYPMDVNDESVGKSRKGAVEVEGSFGTAAAEAWHDTKTFIVAMSVMAVFCLGFMAWAGIRFVGWPLKQLTEQTRLIGQGDYDQPVLLTTRDEFGELSKALSAMSAQIGTQQQQIKDETAARIKTMDQLRHADRLKTVGRLAAGVAHEVGTPLNVISGWAGLIRGGKLSEQELEESAVAIQKETDRITGIVRQLMDFARHNPLNRHSFDLRILVERTIEMLQTVADKNNVKIQLSLSDQKPYTAWVDESQIQQVLTNLIVNAGQAISDHGQVDVSLENVDEDQFVRIQIRDDGSGMDSETLDRIFEPFFTTKDVGEGTGLGLSIAHGIINEHGGSIDVESELGTGTTFSILLPKTEPKA